MSGSGSGPGEPPGEVDCSKLRFATELASPQPRVVATIRVGMTLPVEIDTSRGGPRIIVRTRTGAVVGALISGRMMELLRCLQSGETFVADVTRVDGGDVGVLVRHS